jgi:hypothetical protein
LHVCHCLHLTSGKQSEGSAAAAVKQSDDEEDAVDAPKATLSAAIGQEAARVYMTFENLSYTVCVCAEELVGRVLLSSSQWLCFAVSAEISGISFVWS